MSEGLRVVVVGASLGGLRVVEALRSLGWSSPITVIGDERHMPYNRPTLTKGAIPDEADVSHILLKLRQSTTDIDWRLGESAVGLDAPSGVVELASGERVPYDGLVIATGVRPRLLTIPAEPIARHSLRTFDDYAEARKTLRPGARVVCVGGGFIGCEIAGSAAARGCEVSVVDVVPAAMSGVLGTQVGQAIQERHEARGVRFLMQSSVARFSALDGGAVVVLDDGTQLPADVVIEAVGTVPNVEWLRGSGLDLTDGVLCDRDLRAVGLERTVAVGDIARFPNPLFDETPRRVEHWNMAGETARRAAETLLGSLTDETGDSRPFRPLPSFWSDQQVVRIQSFGWPARGDRVEVLEGDLESSAAIGYFERERRVGVVLLDLAKRAPFYRAWLGEELDL